MDKLTKHYIEFKESSTGSYSPWHLDIADEYDEPLWGTSDIGNFVKIGDDIYKIYYPTDYYKLYEHFCMLEDMNDKGQITDEQVLNEINIILNNLIDTSRIKKCMSLDEFRKLMEKTKNNE